MFQYILYILLVQPRHVQESLSIILHQKVPDLSRVDSGLKHECSVGCSLPGWEMEIEISEPAANRKLHFVHNWFTIYYPRPVYLSLNYDVRNFYCKSPFHVNWRSWPKKQNMNLKKDKLAWLSSIHTAQELSSSIFPMLFIREVSVSSHFLATLVALHFTPVSE